MNSFYEFLRGRQLSGGFSTEDVLGSFLPLLREVVESHAAGFVAPLEGVTHLHVEGRRIWFEEAHRQPARNAMFEIRRIESANRAAVEILAESRRTSDVEGEPEEIVRLEIGGPDDSIVRPVYLAGYLTWEHRLGHHDPLTDVLSLGLILASLACGLDLFDPHDLESFVANRRNLFALEERLHPVLAQAILRMTELDRHRRAQDLSAVLRSLEQYREQEVDFDLDLAQVHGFKQRDVRSKQQVVMTKLRERLFDISRRNNLLNFRPTMQSVNLTHASVPLSFDIRNIRADQILVWNEAFSQALLGDRPVSLNKYLNFAEALYLPAVLDRIISETRRDQAEYGFAQLRLVACTLSWANLKERPPEHFDSPLILIPVQLVKSKGIRDTYQLQSLASEAEINPVLRHLFQQLYNIDLPETIDLAAISLEAFCDQFTARIQASEPAVTVNRLDRPRIDLLHDKARRKLDQYRLKARVAGRGVRTFLDLDYSYDPANYHPLGIKLFGTKVRPPATHLREIIEEQPRPRSYVAPEPQPAVVEKERSFFQLKEAGESNPYLWNIDLCSITLANFRYRKMSLVRDYEALLRDQPDNAAFDAAFSLTPRPVRRDLPEAPPLGQRYDVVPCDPTQASAIVEARRGQSYIIQGPPGTGKSQTITNLIADYVARGKRVLFVCEKRAAIDVVYARLKQCGLDPLCCLIHDSQTDKREFVLGLKQTYESFLAEKPAKKTDPPPRAEVLSKLEQQLKPLEVFEEAMHASPEKSGLPLRMLLDRCIDLRQHLPDRTPAIKERLPDYIQWHQHQEHVEGLTDTLREIEPSGILSKHPLRRLALKVADLDRPIDTVGRHTAEARGLLDRVTDLLKESAVKPACWASWRLTRELFQYASLAWPLARIDQFSLADPKGKPQREFLAAVQKLRERVKSLQQAHEAARHWKQKLPPDELTAALEQSHSFERGLLNFLKPTWWRLRSILQRCYDFSAHAVRPSWSQVLSTLDHVYLAEAAVQQLREKINKKYRLHDSIEEFAAQVTTLSEQLPALPAEINVFHAKLLKSDGAKQLLEDLQEALADAERLETTLSQFLENYDDLPSQSLSEELTRIEDALDGLPDYLPCLTELAKLPEGLRAALRELDWTTQQLEAATADRTLEDVYRLNRDLSRFTGLQRDKHVAQLEKLYDRWLDANAADVCGNVRQRFLERVNLAGLAASQLTPEQKEFKKHYSQGRRELEHEFGKTMRYRSIRDLVTGETGEVVKDLKPVWLMSPLSVSDTIPLDTDFVDVVIFDEASQVPLEEAVPSIFRGRQVIVVGDEMQLPPTDFFSARQTPDDEEELLVADGEQQVRYDLDSNSLLNHAAKNLPSTMLGWHYRSRSESLISFSNWAFYHGRLLTVPEQRLPGRGQRTLRVETASDAEANVADLLERPISFHRLTRGVYDKRRNRAEAETIAQLVRGILKRRQGHTIGVIAFSETQQSEIENALTHLGQDDAEFRELLEAELEREQDGQFVGLLVKNLENIQGDERDVVLLSICYGYGPDGKMLMNFGPINKSGGEKRLNVAFSRAKQHMAVISSIGHVDIKNEYNDGANCLKNYLRYAEAVSEGDTPAVRRVLGSISRWQEAEPVESAAADTVSQQLIGELTGKGYVVEQGIGQSYFRVDLAVRKPGETAYRLGILVDTFAWYEQADLLERELMRPRLLRSLGWNVAHVLAKDWHQDPLAVLSRLVEQIEQ